MKSPLLTNVLLLILVLIFGYWVHMTYEASNNRFDVSHIANNFPSKVEGASNPRYGSDGNDELVQTSVSNSKKLTPEQFEQFLDIQSQKEQDELKQLFGKNGFFTTLFYELSEREEQKKQIQISRMDKKIQELIFALDESNREDIKLKLSLISWTPIGHTKIDKDMSAFYEKKINTLLDKL